MADIEVEEFQSAVAGLKKSDMTTVGLRINGHMFAFASIDAFKSFAIIMLANAQDFSTQAAPRPHKKPDLKVVH